MWKQYVLIRTRKGTIWRDYRSRVQKSAKHGISANGQFGARHLRRWQAPVAGIQIATFHQHPTAYDVATDAVATAEIVVLAYEERKSSISRAEVGRVITLVCVVVHRDEKRKKGILDGDTVSPCVSPTVSPQKRGRSVAAPPYHSFIGSCVLTDLCA